MDGETRDLPFLPLVPSQSVTQRQTALEGSMEEKVCANLVVLAYLGQGMSHTPISVPEAGIPCLFLISFPNCSTARALGI